MSFSLFVHFGFLGKIRLLGLCVPAKLLAASSFIFVYLMYFADAQPLSANSDPITHLGISVILCIIYKNCDNFSNKMYLVNNRI